VDDVLDAIVQAKDDQRIEALFLDLDSLAGGGLDKLIRVSEAIEDFKASGKKVIASGDSYAKAGYFLATAADEIHLNELGIILLDGYGRWRSYHKEGIDKLEVDWNVFKVGEFKSAVEPFLRNEMSEEAELANREYLSDLWAAYVDHIAEKRGMTADKVRGDIEQLVELMAAASGDTGQLALDTGLVDHIGPRQAVRDRMIELVGENEEGTSFAQINMPTYLEALGESRHRNKQKGDGVGIVVARGTILDGSHPPGTIGGDSTAQLIRQARQDDSVKAVVLRVDSGGGSAFASEVIRKELELLREAGKPVVTSMGSVAASGGYWIATTSDEIWASPVTITGSIGIFGMFPTFQEPLKKYMGTQVDGVGTTWLSGAFRPDKELDPRAGELFQLGINNGYQEFLERVGEARNMTPEEVNQYAQGRVWSGTDAFERGLIDQLGDIDAAVASAAKLADLGDDYAVSVVTKELEFKDQLLIELMSKAHAVFGPIDVARLAGFDNPSTRTGLSRQVLDMVDEQLGFYAQWNDPRGIYAHCLCEVE
ncbi:MAG: signal peptide peptidase SppA, partial [Acidobacteriota bacterium]